jgi:large subunit ribosomal protein L25
MGDTLRLDALQMPQGVTLLDDPETVVATVTQPMREEEAEPVEGEAAAEGEAPEGEAGAEEAAAEGDADAGTGESGEPGTVEG